MCITMTAGLRGSPYWLFEQTSQLLLTLKVGESVDFGGVKVVSISGTVKPLLNDRSREMSKVVI